MQKDKQSKWLIYNMLEELLKIINRKVKSLDKQRF